MKFFYGSQRSLLQKTAPHGWWIIPIKTQVYTPRACARMYKNRPAPFPCMAECRTRRLNQTLSVLSLSSLWMCLWPLLRCVILCYLCVLSPGCSCEVVSVSARDWLERLVSDMKLIGDVKPYSLTHSPNSSTLDGSLTLLITPLFRGFWRYITRGGVTRRIGLLLAVRY